MNPVSPDDEKDLRDFYREWYSCYTPRNPIKPPSIVSMRILFQYYTDGSIPGDFIASILQNDLYGAFNHAPMAVAVNEFGEMYEISEVELLNGTIQYLTVRFAIECYGNAEKFAKWINKKKKESTSGRKTKYY